MAQVTSGQVLRETRERKGYDVSTVARRLRIRTDILKAIESNDFNNMPSRGYTRNMINAYARLLGLNPTEIVNMYLDEAYANQVKRARNKAAGSHLHTSRDRKNRVTKRPVSSPSSTGSIYGDLDNPFSDMESPRSPQRRLFDDRTQYSRDDYGISRYQQDDLNGAGRRSSRDYLSNHSGYANYDEDEYDYAEDVYALDPPRRQSNNRRSSRMHNINSERRRRGQIYAGQTPMDYRAPRFSGLSSRLPLIIVLVVVVVIVAAVLFFVFGRGGGTQSNDVSTLPVSGISDTTGTGDDSDDELTIEVAPTAARIVYSVAEGDEVYLEIYENGSQTPTKMEMITGPEEKSVETTGTWTITTYTPDLLNITVNGEPIRLKQSDQYNGMSAYTVDFNAILQEWNRTHASKGSQRSKALSDAANAASEDAKAKAEAKNTSNQTTNGSSTTTNSGSSSNTTTNNTTTN